MITNAEYYYYQLNHKKVIAVDFDNTICLDEWPYVGPIINDAIIVLKELKRNGHRLILYTQRSKSYPICCPELEKYQNVYTHFSNYNEYYDAYRVDILTDAIKVCNEHGIVFDDINQNHLWESNTQDDSRKLFADYFIDDHNVGMKYNIITNKFGEQCKVCDWKFIDEWFVNEGLYKNKVL